MPLSASPAVLPTDLQGTAGDVAAVVHGHVGALATVRSLPGVILGVLHPASVC